jgi:hypothetical protein
MPSSLATMQHSLIGWWPAFTVPPSQATGFIQSISMSFNTSFNYGLFTARRDVTPRDGPPRDSAPEPSSPSGTYGYAHCPRKPAQYASRCYTPELIEIMAMGSEMNHHDLLCLVSFSYCLAASLNTSIFSLLLSLASLIHTLTRSRDTGYVRNV